MGHEVQQGMQKLPPCVPHAAHAYMTLTTLPDIQLQTRIAAHLTMWMILNL